MKKLMILGAGIYQVPLIRTAKRMGLYTIAVSIKGNYPGFALADKVYELDTRDCEAVLAAARKEQIDGICTSGTDVAVRAIGYVCQELGLNGIPFPAAQAVTDKAAMKEAFLKGGVRAAAGIRVHCAVEALDAAARIGYPVVIKRVDSSGSRGISVVSDASGIPSAFERAICGSSRDYVLAEAFLSGTEIGVDGFVQNGTLTFLAPHDKFVCHGSDITVPAGHAFPYHGSDRILAEIARQMQLAVDAVGLDQCPVNADVFVDQDQVSIIEIGGRTGATCIPELISRYYGFDFYEKMILSALGEDVTFDCEKPSPCMAKLLISPVSGTITRIDRERLDRLSHMAVNQTAMPESGTAQPGASGCTNIEIALDYEVGQQISAMKNGTDRIGHVIADTEEETALDALIAEVKHCIEIDGRALSLY